MALTPIARRAAEAPEDWALRDDDRLLTWSELDEAVRRGVHALDSLRLGPEERLAIMARNSVDTMVAYLAALHAGISVIPVSFHLTAREVAYILTDGLATAVLTDTESEAVGREACYAAGARHAASFDGTDGSSWAALLRSSSAALPDYGRRPRPNLLYTSGTTGFPKGVERPLDLPDSVDILLDDLATAAGEGPFLVVGPLYHTGPQRSVRRLAGGRPVYVMPSFDAEAVLATISRFGITGTLMVPAHFIKLLSLPEAIRARYDVSSLRVVDHTGAACPVEVKRAMIAWWGPVLVEKYGGTESGTLCSITSPEWLEHPGSVGRALAPFEVVVVSDEGEEVPSGVDGRLYFRDTTGAGIAFFRAPDKTAEAHLAPNIFTVGDSGHVDGDGYVFITGRHTDMVVSGGVNLYPAESENVIREHPGVLDVAVIGVPHATMGEELKALVVRSDPELTGSEVMTWCRARLAHPKCPRSVDFVADLGRTPMGKLNKKALAEPYWAGATTP